MVRDTSVEDEGIEFRVVDVAITEGGMDVFYILRSPDGARDALRRISGALVVDRKGVPRKVTGVKTFGTHGGVTFGAISVAPLTFTPGMDFTLSFNGVIESIDGAESWVSGDWRLLFLQRMGPGTEQEGTDVLHGADDPALSDGPAFFGQTVAMSWALDGYDGAGPVWYCVSVEPGTGARQISSDEFPFAPVSGNAAFDRTLSLGQLPTSTPAALGPPSCAEPERQAAVDPTPTPTAVPGLISTPQPVVDYYPAVPTPVVYPENPGTLHCQPGASCPPPIFPGWGRPERMVDDQSLRLAVEGVVLADDRVDIIYSVKRLRPGPEGHREPSDVTVSASTDIDIRMLESQALATIGPTTLGVISFVHGHIASDTVFTLRVSGITEMVDGAGREIAGEWELDFLERVRNRLIDGEEGDFHPLQDMYLLVYPQEPYVDRLHRGGPGPRIGDGMVLRMVEPGSGRFVDLYFVADRVNGLRHVSYDDYLLLMSYGCPEPPHDTENEWVCGAFGS
jgi:hypothetical protein